MFLDLNCAADAPLHQRIDIVAALLKLGYDGVAWNRVVSGKLTTADTCAIEPVPLLLPDGGGPAAAALASVPVQRLRSFRQLTRLTVALDDPAQLNAMHPGSPVLLSYDLVAVQPATEKLLHAACTSMEVDIVSFDFSRKLDFFLKQPLLRSGVVRGLSFEVCYAPALRELSARKFVISNALGLVAAARAHNVLLSSGAARALELRGPYDVANLGLLFGLKADVAKNSIGSTALSAALHGETRRTHKSVLSSVDIARLAHSERWKLKTAEHRSPAAAAAAAAAAATTRTSDASTASAAADDAPGAASTTAAAAPAVDDVDMADVPPPPPTVTPPPAAAAPGAQQLSPASPPSVDTCRQQQAGGGATVNTAASQQQQRPRSTAATDGGTLPIARVTPVGGPVGSPAGPPAAKKKKKKKKQETKLQPDGGAVVDPTAADILKRKRA